MKRTPPQRRHSVRSSDPFQNFSAEQLSYIGAIALLYNDVEAIVDDLCATILRPPFPQEQLLSRINGIEGKYQLIKLGAKTRGFDDSEMAKLGDLLGDGGFHLLKKWRDAVVHAQVLDARSGVGKVNERQGRVSEVLLTLDALKGLYIRLDSMRVELRILHRILDRKGTLSEDESKRLWKEEPELSDQQRERLERDIQDGWAQAQEHRNQRLSLPPIPEFPEDISAAEAVVKMYETLADTVKATGGIPRA